ncbi:MAG: ABC transporter [Treponemataceae bacterium]
MSAQDSAARPDRGPRSAWTVIFGRELSAYFSSPIAYIVTGLFLVFSGFFFFSVFFLVNRAELRGFFSLLPILFSFFIPALTMRLFAEEKRIGTLETLFTLPVSGFDATMGKFLAALSFSLIMLLPTLAYALTAAVLGDLDPGPAIGGYLGAILLAAGYSAVGIYASAITKNQIVAFFIAFSICAFLTLVDKFLIILPAPIVDTLEFFSAGYHFDSVSRGIIDSRDLLYFASLTALFLWMTVAAVDDRREA